MSTRCQVAIVDSYTDPKRPLLFYRHSDGYPDGVRPTLDQFCEWLRQGQVRDDPQQAAGWLVALGMQEYAENHVPDLAHSRPSDRRSDSETVLQNMRLMEFSPKEYWKIGAYEPSCNWQTDIEWLHIVDVEGGGRAFWVSHQVMWSPDDNLIIHICEKFIREHLLTTRGSLEPFQEEE